MKIIATYDISEDEIKLGYWNQPDILAGFDRADEPFEDAEDVANHIADGIDQGDYDIDILDDNGVSYVLSWEFSGS